ncbi:MAG TPA: hypothetical protein VN578_02535 [Candidatus Binatia bacterium]|jgi:hypothetical protein|nr:hypothetical protein [Candidatus Binatia bacterium]
MKTSLYQYNLAAEINRLHRRRRLTRSLAWGCFCGFVAQIGLAIGCTLAHTDSVPGFILVIAWSLAGIWGTSYLLTRH